MVDLSVEIPTYNEAENIAPLVEQLENLPIALEIIVIDDNSPDGTASVVRSLAEKYGNIKLIVREGKLGLGSAIVDGMSAAESDNIAVMDADLQHPPELLVGMLQKIREGNEVVIASRYVHGGKSGQMGAIRKLISRGATFMAHVMLRTTRKVRDPLSGFFIFRKSILDGVRVNPTGYKILLEILVIGKYTRAVEMPFVFRPRFKGESKLSLREDMDYIHLILKLAEYRPLKFIGVGLSGVLVNEGLLYLMHHSGYLFLPSDAIAIEASIISNFLLNSVWTFSSRRESTFAMRALKYNTVALLGFFINLGVAAALLYYSPLNYLVSNMVGIILAFLANYLGSELFVWSSIGAKNRGSD